MNVPDTEMTNQIGLGITKTAFSRLGYVFREQETVDCGVDAQIELVENKKASSKLINIQLKSGFSWFSEEADNSFVFRTNESHIDYWLENSLPVLIVLCNIDTENCFWQVISKTTALSTGKGWKILVPKTQKVNAGMTTDLKRLVDTLPIHKDYTVVNTSDISHGTAKRYIQRISLNKEHTQSELIDLIRRQNELAINCNYHRNDMTRKHWRKEKADEVTLFIYPSIEDENHNNWVCRATWRAPKHQQQYPFSMNDGDDIGNDIRVTWNDYIEISIYNSENSISKEEFLLSVTQFQSNVSTIIGEAELLLSEYRNNRSGFEKFKVDMTKLFDKIDIVNDAFESLGLAPFECKEVYTVFGSVICYAHNVFIPFAPWSKGSKEEEHILYNVVSQLKYYKEKLPALELELKKVL